jgi:hypothetical protein
MFMKKQIMISLLILSSSTLSAFAVQVKNPKCSEFAKVEDKYTPEYLAVVDGYNHAGKEVVDEVDMGGIITESSSVKDQCKAKKSAKVDTVRKEISKSNPKPESPMTKVASISPAKAKCQDFVNLGEEFQPIAAYWVAGHSKSGKIRNGEVDEEFLARPVMTLVEECKAEPTASFYDKTKRWMKRKI